MPFLVDVYGILEHFLPRFADVLQLISICCGFLCRITIFGQRPMENILSSSIFRTIEFLNYDKEAESFHSESFLFYIVAVQITSLKYTLNWPKSSILKLIVKLFRSKNISCRHRQTH